jgi:hypothetical protein
VYENRAPGGYLDLREREIYIYEEAGSWGRLHNEELHNLYASPNVIRVTKSRRMEWAGHTAQMGRDEKCIEQWFSTFVRLRPSKFIFYKTRARSQQIYS